MLIRTFEDLDAWQAAHQLTLAVYRATKQFPREELFGMTSQIRRAAVSVETNLAEGFGRRSKGELLRYARISDGSLQEVKSLLRLARDLQFLEKPEFEELEDLARRVGALLGGLQAHLGKATALGR